jgi:ubiquinone/menaquinone biosynthesis C-methylase UbiE
MSTIETPQTRDELARAQEAWDRIAPGYDHWVTPTGDWELPTEALRRAGLQAGMRVLDVASGSGALALSAARMGARVTAVDLSPAMIERLNARARDEALDQVEGRVMDGHALELDDDTFDLAGSQFGVMLFPDLPRGLGEMVRVTRPGGRVVVVAYGPPPRVGFLGLFMEAISRVVPDFTGLPDDPPPLPFQIADPDVFRRRMDEAGLREARVEPATERIEFASGADAWSWITNSNPIPAGIVAGLGPEQRNGVRSALDEMVRERAGADGVAVVEAAVHVGVGTK